MQIIQLNKLQISDILSEGKKNWHICTEIIFIYLIFR